MAIFSDVNKTLDAIKNIDYVKIQGEVIDEFYNRVKERTPVKSGAAKEGWFKTEDGVYNDVSYIPILEEGSSDQAPNGFIRITLEEIPDIIATSVNIQLQGIK